MRQAVRVEVAALGAGVRVQGGAAEGAEQGAPGACVSQPMIVQTARSTAATPQLMQQAAAWQGGTATASLRHPQCSLTNLLSAFQL